MCSLVKFANSLPNKCRNTCNWELCVICQINTPDSLSCATEKGRDTLFDAINKRQDGVYRRLYDEFNSLSFVPLNEIKYHSSCYDAYTSKRNLQRLTVYNVQEKGQYHSTCIAHYLLKWKKEDNYSTIKNESEHDIALKKFLDILHHDLYENKKSFTMSSLLDKFCSLLPEGLSTKYSTAKLQTMLQNHYGDTIVIESQKGQGQSNIVFSSSISVVDAIRTASKLKADLFSEVEASFVDVPDMQEDHILHDAVKVLRGSLRAVEISKDFYPSPSDLSHHRSLQFIPPSLMTFLSLLVDDNCFHIESDYNALSHDKARKCIAVAEMIISLHKNNFTPFNFGLALQLYHGNGS